MSIKLLPDGVPLFVVLAGIAGAVLSAIMDWDGPKRAARKLAIGSATSVYMTPLAVSMLRGLGLPDQQGLALAGFLTGILGVLIIEVLYQVAAEHLKPLLARIFGGSDAKDS